MEVVGTWILAIFLIAIMWVYVYFQKCYGFWKRIDVEYIEPQFPTGNVPEVLSPKIHFSNIMKTMYTKFKHMGDFVGLYFFHQPVLLVLSPEFAKTIMIRDFNYFIDRGVYSNEKDDPLSANLFFMEGPRWRTLRAKLTPTFTSGKLKMMFHTILAVGDELKKYLAPFANDNEDIEIREVLARFTTDIIGSCAFGIDCNSLVNPQSKFREMGKRMINFPKLKALKIFFAMMFRNAAQYVGICFNDQDVSEFFMRVVRDTINHRKSNEVKRKDFMQLLLDLKDSGKLEEELSSGDASNPKQTNEGLSFEEIAAQAFVFFFAGFETSATTMTFALHLLSLNQDIQERARDEVNRVLDQYDGELSYDAIMEMEYLGRIVDETLRIHPPVATLHRISTKDYQLPNGSILPKGIGLVIPTLGFHHDASVFPDPLKFDPERFTEEAKAARHAFLFLPFGEGPRICIGMRFGLLQTRMGLAILLKNYRFKTCSRTEIPLKINPVNLIYTPAGDVWLNIETAV